MNSSDFLIWCLWAYLEAIWTKLWKKGQNSALQGQKTAIFGPFRSFSDLEICPVNEFFCFFNMVFLSVFRSYLQKIVKEGQYLSLNGQKLAILAIFAVFWTFFLMNEFSDFLLCCFWAYLEVIYKKLWKDQILKGWKTTWFFKYHKN